MIASFPCFFWPTIPLIDLVERVGGVSGCGKSTQETLVGKLLRCIFIGWVGPERDNTAVHSFFSLIRMLFFRPRLNILIFLPILG